MQRVKGRGLLCHCPKELKIQDAPNESTDAAGRKEDHLIRKKTRVLTLRKRNWPHAVHCPATHQGWLSYSKEEMVLLLSRGQELSFH